MAAKRPSKRDLELWGSVLDNVRPLPGRVRPQVNRDGTQAIARSTPQPEAIAIGRTKRGSEIYPTTRLDAATSRKCRRGRIHVEATLDLHGMTQTAAHAALARFVVHAHHMGRRTVLVITGKGRRMQTADEGWWAGDGILKSRLHDWLRMEPLRRIVHSYTASHQRHGGDGAYYLFLRKYGQSAI